MESEPVSLAQTWRTAHGDMSDDEWELIADLIGPRRRPGDVGRPRSVDRRAVVDAIFYVTATGCQWRALPERYPNWNTVHRMHLEWSRIGTWERIATRLANAARHAEGRDAEPSAGIVDARSVRAASTVGNETKGYDAGKKIKGRKTFGIVDTNGLLIAIAVIAASASDNAGGIVVADAARERSSRFRKLWCDAGFKRTFIDHCRRHHVAVEVVTKIAPAGFEVLPRRWVVERTWSWLMNHRAASKSTMSVTPSCTKGSYGPPRAACSSADSPNPPQPDRAGQTSATASYDNKTGLQVHHGMGIPLLVRAVGAALPRLLVH